MRHYTRAEWTSYLHDVLSESEREQYDQHLYSCEECLALYMECLEDGKTSLPLLTDEQQFADAVMVELSRHGMPAVRPQIVSREPKRSQVKPWYQQTIFHYGVAAAITLILMSAGVFQQVFAVSTHLTASTQGEQQSSFSDRLMQKAVTVIDTIRLSEQRR
ncbi:hypothetical protein ACI7RC_21040 [Brevibacillus sp. B_LB10_24]|uniref:hypothetical protein n=1 Tax=Brevibacillus sp. B_LB10_24 TaxID=3380645 RepID=UPI0038BAED05